MVFNSFPEKHYKEDTQNVYVEKKVWHFFLKKELFFFIMLKLKNVSLYQPCRCCWGLGKSGR